MVKDLTEYYKREYKLVSRWWMYGFITLLLIELLAVAILAWRYDFYGDLGEWYFDFGDRLLMIGVFENE